MQSNLIAMATLAAAAVSAHPAVAEQNATRAYTFHHENVLGTSLEITVRAASHAEAQRAETAALAAFDSDARVLSAWDKNSELSRWMATRNEAVKVSPTLLEVLGLFDTWRTQTNGALDASAETAARLWKNATAEGRVPTASEREHAVAAMQRAHWTLDTANGTATRVSDAPLALATFAKSFITSRAADAALANGANGIMLNVGGDIVTRGAMTQLVEVANPADDTENGAMLDTVRVSNRAIATSGSYRRGFDLASTLGAPAFSHIIDPRTATPANHIASSTVIASDATTAGALATAFSILTPAESADLAAQHRDVAYLLVTTDGQHIASSNWSTYQTGTLTPAAYVAAGHGAAAPPAKGAGLWNQSFEVVIQLELARIADPRYRRPYVAVWVEDKDKFPVRTIALWYDNRQRWLPDLKSWYRDDQVRNLAEGSDITSTVASPTRMPGKYTLTWDGKDNDGKLVKAGAYTLCVEIAREHGTYEILKHEMDFNAKPQQVQLGTGTEGTASLDYRKR